MKRNIVLICGMFFALIFQYDFAHAELSYPALYDPALPKYENATLVNAGRSVRSLRDGVMVILESPDEVKDVAQYYEQELGKIGWSAPEMRAGLPMDKYYLKRFTKDDKFFQIIITRMPGKDEAFTRIQINYGQN
ncbi:MAG: hypothetical protein Q8Q33_01415 [Chlamydiota bacterium]|nr:hypothetical protein [Chlamydiota bacterium]